MHHEADAFDLGRGLLEQLQPFPTHRRRVPIGEPRQVAVGTRIVADKTGTDGIANKYENNWYGADFRLNNRRHQIGVGDQDVRCEAHQLHDDGACLAGISRRKANIDVDIAPFLPTQLPQFLPQRRDLSLCRSIALSIPHQYADAPHALGLLCARRERPCDGGGAVTARL